MIMPSAHSTAAHSSRLATAAMARRAGTEMRNSEKARWGSAAASRLIVHGRCRFSGPWTRALPRRCRILRLRRSRAGRQASHRPAISSVTCSAAISFGDSASSVCLVLVAQRDLDDLLAVAADGEGEFAVAGAVVAGDEGRAGLKPVHHAELHQLVQRAIDRRRMGDARDPHPVEDGIGAQGLLRLAQAESGSGPGCAKLGGRGVVMGGVHAR